MNRSQRTDRLTCNFGGYFSRYDLHGQTLAEALKEWEYLNGVRELPFTPITAQRISSQHRKKLLDVPRDSG